jgi:hypothetical protein
VAWSGRLRWRSEPGEDHGEYLVAGWQAQDELTGVMDQPGGDAEQSVPQGGDHGFAVADASPASGSGVLG